MRLPVPNPIGEVLVTELTVPRRTVRGWRTNDEQAVIYELVRQALNLRRARSVGTATPPAGWPRHLRSVKLELPKLVQQGLDLVPTKSR
jgi:hypothetical protein